MKFLGIDTTKTTSYIILINEENMDFIKLAETRKVSENLLFEIDNILNKNNLKIEDIDIFGAVIGPGSFTGVRIGIATLKAFNFVFNKNLIKLNSFEVFEKELKEGLLILKNTKTSSYVCEIKNNKLCEIEVVQNSKLNTKLKYANIGEEHIEEINQYFFDNYLNILYNAFKIKIEKEDFVKSADFKPEYIEVSQAEKNLKMCKDE